MARHSCDPEVIIELVDIIAYGKPRSEDEESSVDTSVEEVVSTSGPSALAEERAGDSGEAGTGAVVDEDAVPEAYETASEYGMERYPGWIAYRSDESETMLIDPVSGDEGDRPSGTDGTGTASGVDAVSNEREEADDAAGRTMSAAVQADDGDLADDVVGIADPSRASVVQSVDELLASSDVPKTEESDASEQRAEEPSGEELMTETPGAASAPDARPVSVSEPVAPEFAVEDVPARGMPCLDAVAAGLSGRIEAAEAAETLNEEEISPAAAVGAKRAGGPESRIEGLERRLTLLEKDVAVLAARIETLEALVSAGDAALEVQTAQSEPDGGAVGGENLPGESDMLASLASLRVRVEALEALPRPDEESIARDVLGTVRVELDRFTAEQSASIVKILSEMQRRVRELEMRPAPQLILPELPDVEGVVETVLERLRGELDSTVAAAAARVLREEIAALRNTR